MWVLFFASRVYLLSNCQRNFRGCVCRNYDALSIEEKKKSTMIFNLCQNKMQHDEAKTTTAN